MAKPIIVESGGKVSQFEFSKLSRSKLYGRRRRVALDPSGEPCKRAALTADGSLLIQRGMTAQGYFDESSTWVPNRELVGLDPAGQPLEKQPSTLGEAQSLQGPVAPSEVNDLRVDAIYQLDPVEIDPGLQQQLDEGQFFRFTFNYRADYRSETAFLVANKTGIYALVGQPAAPQWCELEQIAPAVADDDDPFADDLDFEML